jgi:hypothetical protein
MSSGKATLKESAAKRLLIASRLLYLIGAVNVIYGWMSLRNYALTERGLPFVSRLAIIMGVVLLVLGFLVSRRSRQALGIAAGLLTLDIVAALIFNKAMPWPPLLLLVFLRLCILFLILQGFGAINALQQGQGESREDKESVAEEAEDPPNRGQSPV